MDRLADDLTWLGDHYTSLHVVRDGEAPAAPADAGPLLDAVRDALAGVERLSRTVDLHVATAAIVGLDADVGRLEQAGREAEAETDARIEIDRLLGGLQPCTT